MRDFFNVILLFSGQPDASSSEGAHGINFFSQFLILSLVIFVIVCFMAIVGAVRYYSSRKKGGESGQTLGNAKLEITWTVLPLIVVTVFFFLTLGIV